MNKKCSVGFGLGLSLVLASFVGLEGSARAAGPSGHTCEPDLANLCLGVAQISREEAVKCLREHFPKLTPACKEVMQDSNFKRLPEGKTVSDEAKK